MDIAEETTDRVDRLFYKDAGCSPNYPSDQQ